MKAITAVRMPIENAKASVRMLQDETVENVRAVLAHFEAEPSAHSEIIAALIREANAQRLA